jgi:hypothetical protein
VAQPGSGPPRYPTTRGPFDRDSLTNADKLPAWATPSPVRTPRRRRLRSSPARDSRPGPRAHAGRVRRTRQRAYFWGGLAGVAAIIAVLIVVLPGGSARTGTGADGFVSTFQPGEFRSVPGACSAVSAATLQQYLPGRRVRVAPLPVSGAAQSQCDWTLDRRPVYRLLDVTAQAYAPSGLASGNGSATSAAKDAFSQALRGLARPPRATHQPRARITPIPHLGTAAFSAFQAISAGGDVTNRVTVMVRLRNVLITVEFSGLAHTSRGGYGPVSPDVLIGGALAAARDILGQVG